MTVGAALSGPQHAELERIVPPTQKPVEKVQREPSPTADASDGQCVSKAAPEPPRKMDLPLADPLPADDLGERIAKLFASFFALRRQQLLFLARVPSLSFNMFHVCLFVVMHPRLRM